MASNNVVTFTDGEFDAAVLKAPGVVVVDFWASWCGPCRQLGPIIDEVATEYAGKVKVGKLNVDENPSVTMNYRVTGIPATLFFKNGVVVDQIIGLVDKTTIRKTIDKLL